VTTTTDGGTGDGGPTPDGSTGGGADGATGTSEAGIKDAGTFDSALPTPANVIIANTAPGVPPFRLCLATGTGTNFGVTPVVALPDGLGGAPAYPATGTYPAVPEGTPGIYPGTIGAFPTVTDLSTITLTPFVVLSSSIAGEINLDGGLLGTNSDGGAEDDCVHLIGTHGLGTGETAASATVGTLTPGKDFFQLPAIPASTLLDQKTYLLTINGCLPGGTPGAALGLPETVTCGADYDGGNSMSVGYVTLDTTTAVTDGGIGIQFAHRSTAIENTPIDVLVGSTTVPVHTPATAGVWPAFIQPGVVGSIPNDAGDDAGDAGDAGSTPVYGSVPTTLGTAPITYSGNGLTAPTQSVTLSSTDPTVIANEMAFGVFIQPLDGGAPNGDLWPGTPSAPGDLLALPLSTIQVLSAWNASTASAPTGFQAGQAYTFILVGDPAEPQQLTTANPDGGSTPVENPNWNGRGVHILAFPNVFTAQKLH
jgi:hypothetical protein